VKLAAISGTFNAAHPDPGVRGAVVQSFSQLAAAAAELGIPVITLSSGSRDAEDIWRYHADNSTPEAWRDSRDTLLQLASVAEDAGVTIAVEPEHTNVVATADLARTMLQEVGSSRLKIVFDAANPPPSRRGRSAPTSIWPLTINTPTWTNTCGSARHRSVMPSTG
jgi:sugar phosphate isomerase/epimerase